MLSERSQSQKSPQSIYLCEISRISKSIETEIKLKVAREEEKLIVSANKYRVLFEVTKMLR